VALPAMLMSGLTACGNSVVPTPQASTSPLACSSSRATVGPLESPEAVVATDGSPFSVLSIPGTDLAVASVTTLSSPSVGELDVLRIGAGTASLVRSNILPVASSANGMALSHNGRWLAVTTFDSGTLLISVAELLAGSADPVLGHLEDGTSGQIEAAFSIDDHYLFVTDEDSDQLSVFDVERALGSGFNSAHAAVGRVLLSPGPVGIAVSPDGRWVYVTTEGPSGGPGFLWMLDEHIASQDPAAAVASHVGAGCNPVRVALSPDGDVAWVTARASNALIGFSTAEMLAQPSRALKAVVLVGLEPVGLALYDGGRYAVVANSGRFAGSDVPQNLTVVDLPAALAGRVAVVIWIAAGTFPREVATDGSLGLVTNYGSDTVEVFRVPG
jgi:DNA-binding beta-propeller fold protein YncE